MDCIKIYIIKFLFVKLKKMQKYLNSYRLLPKRTSDFFLYIDISMDCIKYT